MNRRKQKRLILSLLSNEIWPNIAEKLDSFDEKAVIHHLFTALSYPNEICKWHAVSGFGRVVSRLSKRDLESARIIMRRFLWQMNDESGGIGWGIPEAMGEVMAQDDILYKEYSHMLISYMKEDGPGVFEDGNFIELPALQQGVLWGVARLLASHPNDSAVHDVAGEFYKYLHSPDLVVSGMAAWCIGFCGNEADIIDLEKLRKNHTPLHFYWDNQMHQVTVSKLVEKAITNIKDHN